MRSVLGVLLLGSLACTSIRVVTDRDPDANHQALEPYIEGTLEIEVVDAHSGRRVWHGRGQTLILSSGRLIRDSVDRVALEEVRAILKKFPEAD